jgi:hypothetical protein
MEDLWVELGRFECQDGSLCTGDLVDRGFDLIGTQESEIVLGPRYAANLLRRYQKEMKAEHITIAERKRSESDGMERTYREIWGDPTQYFCGGSRSR